MRIGFLVNPIAGMGGAVGLKGTDGDETRREAEARGAVKIASGRAIEALRGIVDVGLTAEFLTCTGEMGKSELDSVGIDSKVVYRPADKTTSGDTKRAARVFVKDEVDVILFSGGDGTARDILEAVGTSVPIIGIPSGVKMHSAVFAYTPGDIADLLANFSRTRAITEAEVVDIDEDKFREGILSTRLYGLARVPSSADHVQSGKTEYTSDDADEEAEEIAHYIAEGMTEGTVFILGPGGTTERVARNLGEKKTLLGVDVVINGKIVSQDASENDLLRILKPGVDARIVVSPIGAQGVFFGRGNQQISPKVIRTVGKDNVIVVATPTKLKGTPVLRTDTGDAELDEMLKGTLKVVTGYRRRKVVQVK